MTTPIKLNDTAQHSAHQQSSNSLLRLMQLVSPTLPVGAFAYSQGLEYAVEQNWVHDENSTELWINGILNNSLCQTDLPIAARLFAAWQNNNTTQVQYWNDFLFASRESAELQQEDHQLGRSLARLLADLDIERANDWKNQNNCCFVTLFTLASVHWQISLNDMLQGYCWAWLENQVAAAIKLVPLGQTSGQRILVKISTEIPDIIQRSKQFDDDEIGFAMPGLAIASALHETQYTRLFRS